MGSKTSTVIYTKQGNQLDALSATEQIHESTATLNFEGRVTLSFTT